MIFSEFEKESFILLNNLVHSIETNIERIISHYHFTEKGYLYFDGFTVNYNDFIEDFRYSLTYLERVLSLKIPQLKSEEQFEKISAIINNYAVVLNDNLEKDPDPAASGNSFAQTFFNTIVNFLNDISYQNPPFNGLFAVNEFEARFNEFVKLIRALNLHFNHSAFENAFNQSDFLNHFLSLKKGVEELYNKSIINEEDFKNRVDSFFASKGTYLDNRSSEFLISYNNRINEIQSSYENELKEKISELTDKFDNNKYELDSLLGDVKLYQDKMTNKAVSEMSAHYFNKSVFERNSYFFITILTAIIIIFSVVSAYRGVNSYYNQYVSTEACDKNEVVETQVTIIPPVKLKSYEECIKDLTTKREATQKYALNYLIFRLSFSLLLFLAVIYASRIAMRAYNHWRQSENMYLKLNTLSPFIGSLDKPVRNEVHLSLVPDYFGKDAGIVENSKDSIKDIPTNISNLAMKAIEQAGSTIGNKLGSDKEPKNSNSESNIEKNGKKSDSETG